MEPKQIENPLSNYNNCINEITEELERIYVGKTKSMSFRHGLIFENRCITINGKIKLNIDANSELHISFLGDYDIKELKVIKQTYDNINCINSIFNKYLFLANIISCNYDHTVSLKYVNTILAEINRFNILDTRKYTIPYKLKINYLYDNKDKTLDNLYNRFSYVLCVVKTTDLMYKMSIQRVLSSELNECKSLDNMRFEEIETIEKTVVKKTNLDTFLSKLFFYGELIK